MQIDPERFLVMFLCWRGLIAVSGSFSYYYESKMKQSSPSMLCLIYVRQVVNSFCDEAVWITIDG